MKPLVTFQLDWGDAKGTVLKFELPSIGDAVYGDFHADGFSNELDVSEIPSPTTECPHAVVRIYSTHEKGEGELLYLELQTLEYFEKV